MSNAGASRSSNESPDMSRVYLAKSALRKSMLRTLRAIPDKELEQQSQAVAQILFDSPFFRTARSIGCYLSMAKGELRTTSIIDQILSTEKKLYIPYLPPSTPSQPSTSPASAAVTPHTPDTADMKMLRLYSPEDLAKCPLDKWGIPDPGERRLDEEGERDDALDDGIEPLDLILIPGVAFDRDCNRLGRGKAYYDRFLRSYTSSRQSPLLVALALAPQILSPEETVPTTDTDFRLDGVLSPAGLVWRTGAEPRSQK